VWLVGRGGGGCKHSACYQVTQQNTVPSSSCCSCNQRLTSTFRSHAVCLERMHTDVQVAEPLRVL
jgi:hypothetical protein